MSAERGPFERGPYTLRRPPFTRSVTVPAERVLVSPSVSKSYFELLVKAGPTDYRIILTPMMLRELIISVDAALKGRTPPVEMRATSTLPMNPDDLFLVHVQNHPHWEANPAEVYQGIFNAWRSGYFVRLGHGTIFDAIRVGDVGDLPLAVTKGALKYVARISVLRNQVPVAGDILVQRLSGTPANVGRPFYVESVKPLLIRGA